MSVYAGLVQHKKMKSKKSLNKEGGHCQPSEIKMKFEK